MAVSIPDDTAEVVWQAAASLYTLGRGPFRGHGGRIARAAPRRGSLSGAAALTQDSDDLKQTHAKRFSADDRGRHRSQNAVLN
jgi:hypothetical protein